LERKNIVLEDANCAIKSLKLYNNDIKLWEMENMLIFHV